MEKERTAVVFVHGFMGKPDQFDSIKERLGGIAAELFCPVLVGHEGSLEAFLETDGDDWQKGFADFMEVIRRDFDKIILVGHSMGGLIAAREAVRNPEKIGEVIAIGFPIKVTLRPIWLRMMTLASKPAKVGEDPRVTVARSMGGVRITSAGEYFSTLPNNIQFLKVARDTRKKLPQLKVPLTVLNFKKDEIVGGGAKAFVMKALPDTRFYMLDNSYHFLFTPEETDLMASLIRKAAEDTAVARVV